MIRKRTLFFIFFPFSVILLIFITLNIPRDTLPSPDTRIILEHTYQSYIAPTCFEESNPTNFLADSTLESAQKLNYKPHSACTEKALKAEKDNMFVSILKEIGIIDKLWDNW